MHGVFAHFQVFFAHEGLLAVFVLILLENFGLPLPGELALVYAGAQMRIHGTFGLPALILAGSSASALGQAISFGIGRWAGSWMRRALSRAPAHLAHAERYFHRHGPMTIVFSRFVAGLRVLAGPLAGLGKMNWPIFLTYNLIGAVAWVGAASGLGWYFGAHWRRLGPLADRFELWLVAAILAVILLAVWWKWRGTRSVAG